MSHASKANEKNREYELEKNKMEKAAKDTQVKASEKMKDTTDYAKEKAQDLSDYTKEKAQDVKDCYNKEKADFVAKEMKDPYYHQTTYSDVGNVQNRGLYSGGSDKVKGGDQYDYPRSDTTTTSVDEGGILQSAKETIASAYNAVAAKISETAEVAKEKMDQYMHGDQPHVVTGDKDDTPKVGTTLPPGNVSNLPEKEKHKL